MKNFIYISIFILALLVFSGNSALSQNVEKQKFQLAQSFEQNGDFVNSARIYLELYDINKNKIEYLEGIIRTYTKSNRFTELLNILEKHLEYKERFDILAIVGQLHWQTGSTEKADLAWVRALEIASTNDNAYRLVAEAQTNQQLAERAIQTYQMAREELDDPMMFIDELSKLYIITGDFKNGTEEIFNLFKIDNNFGVTQGRLSAMMQDSAANKYVAATLDEKISDSPNNIQLLKLKVWFMRNQGNHETALEMTKRIDDLMRAKGREILKFANDSQQDGELEIALKSYEIIIDMGSSNPYLPTALYSYAKTLELKLALNPELSDERVHSIIEKYKEIAKGNRNKQLEADAKIRMASLYSDYLKNNEKAIELLTDVAKNYKRHNQAVRSVIQLADIYIAKEELDKAREILDYSYRTLSTRFPNSVVKTGYKLAQIEFFSGNIDTALILFKGVAKKTGSDEANNALQKITILETNKQFTLGLETFAQAEYAEFRKDIDESISLYKQLETQTIGTPLAELAIIRRAELQHDHGKYQDCIETIKHLVELYPETIYMDKSLLFKARAYLKLGNNNGAMDAYTELITFHPHSIYLQEARKKIRELRDKKL
jgi:tetratricopeptide (TPR) repeat protein